MRLSITLFLTIALICLSGCIARRTGSMRLPNERDASSAWMAGTVAPEVSPSLETHQLALRKC